MTTDGPVRALVLLLASFTSVGPNGAHEMYNVLQPSLTMVANSTDNKGSRCYDCLGMGDDMYNVMFTMVFWGSALALTVTGLALDKLGNWTIVPMLVLVSLGVGLIAVGGSLSRPQPVTPLILSGAGLLGLGYLPCIVARDRIVSLWFRGQQVGVAFGVVSCVNRLASLIVFLVTEPLRQLLTLRVVLWLTAAVCLFSLACSVAVTALDGRRERHEASESASPKLRDLLNLGWQFWLLLLCYTLCFTVHNTLQDNLTEFVHDTRGRTKFASALIGGSVHYVGIVAGPVSGIIVHRIGRPALLIAAACLLLLPAVGLLAFTSVPPLPAAILTGTCTAFLYTSMIGSVTLVVPRSALGTALASSFCAATVFCGVVHIAVGAILGRHHGPSSQVKLIRWQMVLTLVFGLCCLLLLAALALAGASLHWRTRLSISQISEAAEHPVKYERIRMQEESDSDLNFK